MTHEEQLEQFKEELEALFAKHNILVAYAMFAKPKFEFNDIDWDESKIPDRLYDFNFAEYVNDDIPELIEGDKSQVSRPTLQKWRDIEDAKIIIANHGVLELMNRDRAAKQSVFEIDSVLGLDTARMIALEENKPYYVFTELGVLEVTHAEDVWMVRNMEGQEAVAPTDELYFIGNAQSDGSIFHSEDLPIISTGDRMVFGLCSEKAEGTIRPIYVTSTVRNVVQRQNLN